MPGYKPPQEPYLTCKVGAAGSNKSLLFFMRESQPSSKDSDFVLDWEDPNEKGALPLYEDCLRLPYSKSLQM